VDASVHALRNCDSYLVAVDAWNAHKKSWSTYVSRLWGPRYDWLRVGVRGVLICLSSSRVCGGQFGGPPSVRQNERDVVRTRIRQQFTSYLYIKRGTTLAARISPPHLGRSQRFVDTGPSRSDLGGAAPLLERRFQGTREGAGAFQQLAHNRR
jgi:hypothetical protein